MRRILSLLILLSVCLSPATVQSQTLPRFTGQIVYEEGGEIWILNGNTGERLHLPQLKSGSDLRWSPDGEYLLYTRADSGSEMNDNNGCYLVRQGEWQPRFLFRTEQKPCGVWTPDGRAIIGSNSKGIWWVDVPDGQPRKLINPVSGNLLEDIDPSYDGSWIGLHQPCSNCDSPATFYTLETKTGALHRWEQTVIGAQWVGHSNRLIFTEVYFAPFSGAGLYLADANGQNVRKIFSNDQAVVTGAQLASDGQQVAITLEVDNLQTSEIWTGRTDGTGFQEVLRSADSPIGWSPDGQYLLLHKYLEGDHYETSLLNLATRQRAVIGTDLMLMDWSPDRRQMLVLRSTYRVAQGELLIYDLSSNGFTSLAPGVREADWAILPGQPAQPPVDPVTNEAEHVPTDASILLGPLAVSGQTLVYLSQDGSLTLYNPSTGVQSALTQPLSNANQLYASGSRRHFATGQNLLSVNISNGALTATALRLAGKISGSPPRWSLNETQFSYQDQDKRVWVLDQPSATQQQLDQASGIVSWSFDGKYLSYCTPQGGLRVRRIPEMNDQRLVSVVDCNTLQWSPTADLLAFNTLATEYPGQYPGQIDPRSAWIYDPQRSNPLEQIMGGAGVSGWSPDGKLLAMDRKTSPPDSHGKIYDIYVAHVTGGAPVRLGTFDSLDGSLAEWAPWTSPYVFGSYIFHADTDTVEKIEPGLPYAYTATYVTSGKQMLMAWESNGEMNFGSLQSPFRSFPTRLFSYKHDMLPLVALPGLSGWMSPSGMWCLASYTLIDKEPQTWLGRCQGGRAISFPGQAPLYSPESIAISYGDYWLAVTPNAYQNKLIVVNLQTGESQTLLARPGARAYWINAPIPKYSIRGHVFDKNGQPLRGVDVALGGVDQNYTRTEADGAFEFSDLLAGEYSLNAARRGLVIMPAKQKVNVPPDTEDIIFRQIDTPVVVTRFEANQALGQELSSDSKGPMLVAGKRTVLRAFLNVPVKLHPDDFTVVVKRDGKEVRTLHPFLYTNPKNILDFVIDTTWDSGTFDEGTYTFELYVYGLEYQYKATFQKRRTIRILAIPVKVKHDGQVLEPGPDWQTAYEFTRRVYPVADQGIQWDIAPTSFDATGYDLHSLIDLYRLYTDIAAYQPAMCKLFLPSTCYDQLIGFIPAISIPSLVNPTVCLKGYTYNGPFASDAPARIVMTNGSIKCSNEIIITEAIGMTLAHEIGHGYGLGDEYNVSGVATVACDVNPPPKEYLNGACSNSTAVTWEGEGSGSMVVAAQDYPFDVIGLKMALKNKLSFMGRSPHADDFWVTPAIYKQLFKQLAPPGWFGFQTGAPAASSQVETRWLSISGQINRAGQGNLNPGYSAMTKLETPQEAPATGAYSVEVLDAAGQTLAKRSFDVSFTLLTDPPQETSQAPFQVQIPLPFQSAVVRLRHDEQILQTHLVSAHPPSVQVLFPNGSESWKGNIPYSISWQGTDVDGSSLTYQVLYTPDGIRWIPLASGLKDTHLEVSASQMVGGNSARIRVIASDGILAGQDDSDQPFVVATNPPVATIFAPEENAVFANGELVALDSSAYDPQDGLLEDTAFHWSLDGQGELTQGRVAQTVLPPGQHTLSLRVANSQGQITLVSVHITVGSQTPAGGFSLNGLWGVWLSGGLLLLGCAVLGIWLLRRPRTKKKLPLRVKAGQIQITRVYCANCRTEIGPLVVFCPVCGQTRRPTPAQIAPTPPAMPARSPGTPSQATPGITAPVRISPPPAASSPADGQNSSEAPRSKDSGQTAPVRVAPRPDPVEVSPEPVSEAKLDPAEWLTRGIALVGQGKLQAGGQLLQQVLREQPENAEAWFWLGIAAARCKEIKVARSYLIRAQRLGHPKAAQALAWVESLAAQ